MTQGELPLAVQRKAGLSLVDRLALFFKDRPNVWIDGRELAKIAGAYAWRTRCSDLRKPPYVMTIENRKRRIDLDVTRGIHRVPQVYVISEYRYVPE